MELSIGRLDSPLGTILLVGDGSRLVALDYEGYEGRMRRLLATRYARYRLREARPPESLTRPLRDYLAGDLGALDAIDPELGGTPFQRRVWAALREIPPGETRSYGALAARLGRPGASRAVGLANARNPVAIVVPCHRVVGADGSLTGYAGGLERKRWLLAHEAAALA